MQQQQENNSAPVVVTVALLPNIRELNDSNRNLPAISGKSERLISSVSRINAETGNVLTLAEYLKYLVEVAAPELWLLAICKRANTSRGVVKLCYGAGYETTVVIGNAEATAKPKSISLGLAVNSTNATLEQIGETWISGSDVLWNHVQARGGNVCVYIRTSKKKFACPPMTEEELHRKRRTIRVWPDREDENSVERMEELESVVPETQPTASVIAPKEARAPAPAAMSEETPTEPSTEARKRSLSTVEEEEGDSEKLAKKKKRQKRDPTKPKAAKSVYQIYYDQNLERVKKENPNLNHGERTKIIAAEVKALDSEQKEHYNSLVAQDKERYNDEMTVWEAKQKAQAAAEETSVDDKSAMSGDSSDDEAKRSSSKPTAAAKKTPKDPSKPKGAKSAYNFFVTENMEEYKQNNPGEKYSVVQKKLTEAYRALGAEEKEKYTEMAAKDKERAGKAEEAWKEAKGVDSGDEQVATKKKKKHAKKDPDKPKHPRSAYLYFSSEHRPKIQAEKPDTKFKEMGKLLGEAWEVAKKDTEVLEKYEAMAAADKERYEREMKEYKAKVAGEKTAAVEAATDSEHSGDEDSSNDNKKPASKPPAVADDAEPPVEDDDSSNDDNKTKPAATPSKSAVADSPPSSPKPEKPEEAASESKTSDAPEAEAAPPEAASPEKKKKKDKKTPKSKSKKRKDSVGTAEEGERKSSKKKKKKKHRKSETPRQA